MLDTTREANACPTRMPWKRIRGYGEGAVFALLKAISSSVVNDNSVRGRGTGKVEVIWSIRRCYALKRKRKEARFISRHMEGILSAELMLYDETLGESLASLRHDPPEFTQPLLAPLY